MSQTMTKIEKDILMIELENFIKPKISIFTRQLQEDYKKVFRGNDPRLKDTFLIIKFHANIMYKEGIDEEKRKAEDI